MIFKPKELSIFNIIDLYHLILSGGQIKLAPAILLKQIVSCELLGIEKNKLGAIIAIAAIKVPQKSYTEKVFAYAGLREAACHYPYELGYCVTVKGEQGKGLCNNLVKNLLETSCVARLFATTQSPQMQTILIKNGFKKAGDTRITEDNRKIDLYTHEF